LGSLPPWMEDRLRIPLKAIQSFRAAFVGTNPCRSDWAFSTKPAHGHDSKPGKPLGGPARDFKAVLNSSTNWRYELSAQRKRDRATSRLTDSTRSQSHPSKQCLTSFGGCGRGRSASAFKYRLTAPDTQRGWSCARENSQRTNTESAAIKTPNNAKTTQCCNISVSRMAT
jgi:hypothetical protein